MVEMEAKSHDTRTQDTEDTKMQVFDMRHADRGNRTWGTLEVYTMYINHNIIKLKFDNDESIIKLSMNHEL